MIRRHETIDDVFARDMVPERLGGPGRSQATGLDHVSVTCSDLDRSIDFYGGLLGIPVRARGESDGSNEFEIAGQASSKVRWADLELGHGQVVELVEYGGRSSPVPGREVGESGATHFAVRVSDVDAAFEKLEEAGVPTRTGPKTIMEPGAWQGVRAFYASDPDGVTVELIQLPAASPEL